MAINAQNASYLSVKNWEMELRIGGTLPLSSNNYATALVGPALGALVRYNLDDSPLSIGAKMELTVARQDICEAFNMHYTLSVKNIKCSLCILLCAY